MKVQILFVALVALALGKEQHGQRKHPHSRAAHENRIVGGSNADRGQFPYQVSIQLNKNGWFHTCGGSIIGTNAILTAGHCPTNDPMRIRAGILNLDDNDSVGQTITVASFAVHPNYVNSGNPGPNDVAILRLSSALSYNDAIKSIGLPAPNSVAIGQAVLSGWGDTSTTNTPNNPNTLQKVTIPIICLDECAAAFNTLAGTSDPLAMTNLCTGPLTESISMCRGDSGGPLAQGNTIVGIVSWGRSMCGTVGGPSVYTRVSSFIQWINDNMS